MFVHEGGLIACCGPPPGKAKFRSPSKGQRRGAFVGGGGSGRRIAAFRHSEAGAATHIQGAMRLIFTILILLAGVAISLAAFLLSGGRFVLLLLPLIFVSPFLWRRR